MTYLESCAAIPPSKDVNLVPVRKLTVKEVFVRCLSSKSYRSYCLGVQRINNRKTDFACNTIQYYVTILSHQLITCVSHQIWRLRKQNHSCDRKISLMKVEKFVKIVRHVSQSRNNTSKLLYPVIPRTLLTRNISY